MNDVSERVRKVLEASLPEGVITENIDDDFPLIELGVGIDSVARLELQSGRAPCNAYLLPTWAVQAARDTTKAVAAV